MKATNKKPGYEQLDQQKQKMTEHEKKMGEYNKGTGYKIPSKLNIDLCLILVNQNKRPKTPIEAVKKPVVIHRNFRPLEM